jgi:hypothetical protein
MPMSQRNSRRKDRVRHKFGYIFGIRDTIIISLLNFSVWIEVYLRLHDLHSEARQYQGRRIIRDDLSWISSLYHFVRCQVIYSIISHYSLLNLIGSPCHIGLLCVSTVWELIYRIDLGRARLMSAEYTRTA